MNKNDINVHLNNTIPQYSGATVV